MAAGRSSRNGDGDAGGHGATCSISDKNKNNKNSGGCVPIKLLVLSAVGLCLAFEFAASWMATSEGGRKFDDIVVTTAAIAAASAASKAVGMSESSLNYDDNDETNILDDAVRLLFGVGCDGRSAPTSHCRGDVPAQEAADAYIRRMPGRRFRFYVYDELPTEYTWQHISKCIEMKYIANAAAKDYCDWGSSVCTVVSDDDNVNTTTTASVSALYTKRRFNRNGDVVTAKIFTEYAGPMRTRDPAKADLFVVPYPR